MTKLTKRILVGLGTAALAGGTAFQLQRLFTAGPPYETLWEHDELEVRRYGPRIVARTRLEGTDDEAKNQGFRRLAGYIFGGNGGGQRIAMTTPVTTEPTSARIAMTTPVETASTDGEASMAFTMPAEWALADLPRPNDSRVVLEEAPARLVAVFRFRGRPSPAEFEAKQANLLRAVEAAGMQAAGPAYTAQYDPPWVLPVLRRNEVMVPVEALPSP
ncbi:MAG: heme-binding protein [Sandaracinaceae bacterium]|nr:heme-binding protein [Sandaracinaceae bacterium]